MILSAYDFCLLPLALSAWAALSASATRGAASENSASRERIKRDGQILMSSAKQECESEFVSADSFTTWCQTLPCGEAWAVGPSRWMVAWSWELPFR